MINLNYIQALTRHIQDVINTELETIQILEIAYLGIFQFIVFYYLSKFAKNIFLKIILLSLGFYTLCEVLHGNRILTEPLFFGIFSLIAPHLNIFITSTRLYTKTLFISKNHLFDPHRLYYHSL